MRKKKSIAYVACLIDISCVCNQFIQLCVCVISAMDDGNCSEVEMSPCGERVTSGDERTEVHRPDS